MLPTIAATVGAAAIAASAVVVPVTGIGDEGWKKAGSGEYKITFNQDTVDFYTDQKAPDMKLAKGGAATLEDIFADGIEFVGDNAHLAFYSYVDVEGSPLPKYTAIVFNTTDDQVLLTYGASPNVWYDSRDDFFADVENGILSGFAFKVEVGHTDTSAQKDETSASVDYVSFADVTYDFGTGADQAPGLPGKGNENGLGNGNGNGNPPAHGHDKN